jgi:hypothetical protein
MTRVLLTGLWFPLRMVNMSANMIFKVAAASLLPMS